MNTSKEERHIMILKCIRTVAVAALALVSVNVSGQDLLARQAPIDRKLKAVDSLALIRQIKAEQAVYPAYNLYPNWQNDRVHAYGNTVQVPDTFRIDLTGFCMPTTHTKITSKCGPRWRRMHNGLDPLRIRRLPQSAVRAGAVCIMGWILRYISVIPFGRLSTGKYVW